MKKINYKIDKKIDAHEFVKIIGFLSEKILEFDYSNNTLVLVVEDDCDEKEMEKLIKKHLQNFVFAKNQSIFSHQNSQLMRWHDKFENVVILNDGSVALKNQALFLFDYFDTCFKKMAVSVSSLCEERQYPVLLPIDEYQKTGYLKNSPQYAIFCSSVKENLAKLSKLNECVQNYNFTDVLNTPFFALSPSACFHVYYEMKNKQIDSNMVLTFMQNVFRNEGRFNYGEFGRLRDYHVREIVFIGSHEYVINCRNELLENIKIFMEEINLKGDISVANDPFIVPRMQKFKKIQVKEKSKYEVHINYKDSVTLSVASLNYHGTAFTHPFRITSSSGEKLVTGCVGFGLERWVLSFLAQYGENVQEWSQTLREEYDLWKKR